MEEDMRREKRRIARPFRRRSLYSLLSLATVFLLVLSCCTGCGRGSETLSASDYQKRISEIHDGVAWDLGYVIESLGEVSGDEYYHLQEVGEVFARARDIFAGAYRALEALDPPEEALELHLDLMHFYADGEREAGTMVNSLGLFQIVLPMLADVDNLALPSLPDQPQPQEIRGAAEEDRRTMEDYLRELEGITPPEDLREYLEKVRGLFGSLRDMVSGVLQAVPAKELESLADFRQRFVPVQGEASGLRGTVQAYLVGAGSRIDGLIERGGELAARIKRL